MYVIKKDFIKFKSCLLIINAFKMNTEPNRALPLDSLIRRVLFQNLLRESVSDVKFLWIEMNEISYKIHLHKYCM
jgi:hypothetical protein